MDRDQAIEALRELEGQDLREIASRYEVTIRSSNGKINKGWAGHAVERFLGLSTNSEQAPDFGSWELKTTAIKHGSRGWQYKETLKITMIEAENVKQTSFLESHMFAKLNKFLLVVRTGQPAGLPDQYTSYVVKTSQVNLSPQLLSKLEEDYNEVRNCLLDPAKGFSRLSSNMGTYIQPRTNGAGHGSTSRAFYARQSFLNEVVPLENLRIPSNAR